MCSTSRAFAEPGFRWRRLMSEGGKQAIRADEDVVPASEARKLRRAVRELERLLGARPYRLAGSGVILLPAGSLGRSAPSRSTLGRRGAAAEPRRAKPFK